MKNTPGPWVVLRDTVCRQVEENGYVPVASVDVVTNIYAPSKDVRAANAKLISACPDLLEACEWINDIISTSCDGGDAWCAVRKRPGASEWANNLMAAIKKAKE